MELFLNFLWALIAVSGLSVWRLCWAPARSGRREPLREWTAIVAALVLLFFAVSLTDDLHSDLVLFEESSNGRRQSIALASVHSSPQGVKDTSAHAGGVLPALARSHQVHCIGCIFLFKQTFAPLPESGLPLGRAPPLFSLLIIR